MKVDLQGKVALVTGAGRGIGRAIADTLAANDARVVYTDRDFGLVEEAVAGSNRHMALPLDVTDREQIERTVAKAIEACGKIDILINNAGIGTGPDERKTVDGFPVAWSATPAPEPSWRGARTSAQKVAMSPPAASESRR